MKEIFEYFRANTKKYLNTYNKQYRKVFSQFFTPENIAEFMIEDIEIHKKEHIRILEPAAGTGILVLVLINKILNDFNEIKSIHITAIELDKNLYKILCDNLQFLKEKLKNKIDIELSIKNESFIKIYGNCWKEELNNLFSKIEKENLTTEKFDLIVSNPPYSKINKNSEESLYFKNLVMGQPNIYHLFIALSLKLLNLNGRFILISPKNYLGGKYTEKLRKYIFENFSLIRLHLFNERKKIFNNEVLQEICIAHFINSKKEKLKITYNGNIKESFIVDISQILIENSNSLLFLRNKKELDFKSELTKNWKTLNEQGLEFKIGQVVQFRINQEDKFNEIYKEGQVPLLIIQHIYKNKIIYERVRSSNSLYKNIALNFNNNTATKVIVNETYVILRKNVDFESDNFIQAAVYRKKSLNSAYIAIDNNLAYIKAIDGKLSFTKAEKICNYLNSEEFEKYYKMLNNSHTINSYEINNMLFPLF